MDQEYVGYMKEFDIKKRILEFFHQNSGLFVSGEDISRDLGFSRAGLWKYIKKLRDEGYEIEAIPHLGYKLNSTPDKIYGYDLSVGLKTVNMGKKSIYYYDSISSTNDRAYELAEEGEPEGTLVISETQTSGKGRIGRKWISPKGDGIYMSLILRPDVETDEIPTITLITALAVIKAISKTCDIKAGIKWPNDVYVAGKKICGILTEIKAQPDLVDFLILGVGINVNTSSAKLPPEGTSLKLECDHHIERKELVRVFLMEFESFYGKFSKDGFKSLLKECKELSLVLGKNVKVDEHNRLLKGKAVDIDEKGALIIESDNGTLQRIFSGDVKMCR